MKKTRHLTTYEFLDILQIEYVVAELRRRIYTKKKDKSYYSRVLEGKKSKIEDICKRNNLCSIFDDPYTKEIYYSKVYLPSGLPDFHYNSKEQIEEYKQKDIYYYYTVGEQFKVQCPSPKLVVGVLQSVNFDNNTAVLKIKGREKCEVFHLENISRII